MDERERFQNSLFPPNDQNEKKFRISPKPRCLANHQGEFTVGYFLESMTVSLCALSTDIELWIRSAEKCQLAPVLLFSIFFLSPFQHIMNKLGAIRNVSKTWARCYTTAVKPDIKLLKELRKETEVSMTKAKEALIKSNNDYAKALAWLSEDAQVSGAKKAQKVAGRVAGEGLITTASVEVPVANSIKSTIVEVKLRTSCRQQCNRTILLTSLYNIVEL